MTQSRHLLHLKDHLVSSTQEVAARFWIKEWDRRWSTPPVSSPGPASNPSASLTDIPRREADDGTHQIPALLFLPFKKSQFGLRAPSMRSPSILRGRFLRSSSGLWRTWDYADGQLALTLLLSMSLCTAAEWDGRVPWKGHEGSTL